MRSLIDELDLDLEAARERAARSPNAATAVLERVAIALASTIDLREVLQLLAEIGQQATGGNHSSLFLLEGRELIPAVAIGRRDDAQTWHDFKSMGPVHLHGERWLRFIGGKPIAIEDMKDDTLIPKAWKNQFNPGAIVLVPLVATGQRPLGLLAIDWEEPRPFSPGELAMLEAIGRYAGVAVRNARAYEDARRHARVQEALTRSAAALAAPFESPAIAGCLVEAYSDLIGACVCAIALFDTERSVLTTVAARGTNPIAGPIPMGELPVHLVERVWLSWERDKSAIEFAGEPWFDEFVGGRQAGAGWYLLLPLVVEDHTRGAVLLGFEASRRLDRDERTAVKALSDIAAASLERCVLLERSERQVRQLDALHRVSAAFTEGTDAPVMVDRVNELLGGLGVMVQSVAFGDDRLATRLGAEGLTPEELEAWRGTEAERVELPDGTVSVPMHLDHELYGALRVKATIIASDEWAFVQTLGLGIAETARRDDLRVAVEEAERDRVITEERERLAGDLHDSAGQVFVAMGLSAKDRVVELEPGTPVHTFAARMVELADRGKAEIDDAARALAFVPAARRGLVPSLHALAEDFEEDSGIEVTIVVHGEVTRLGQDRERALYRVAHESFANAWRHSDSTALRADLTFGDDEIVLTVADNGSGGFAPRKDGTGLSSMRRAMREIDGALVIGPGPTRGVLVRATVARETQ